MQQIEFIEKKILEKQDLRRAMNGWRLKNKVVGFTNGCFDLLHRGHIHTLMTAKDMCDILVVGMNSDNSIKRIKGEKRPFKDQQTRAMLMASFLFVDAVVIFNADTPLEVIEYLKPDLLVKGGDWEKSQIVGADIVESNGGKVVSVPYLEGLSTTNIAKTVRDQGE